MANRLQNEAKTPDMPREMTIEEMERATRPGAADEAFKAGAAAAQAEVPVAAQSVTVTPTSLDPAKLTGDWIREIGELEPPDASQVASGPSVDRVTELRMEMEAKLNHLMIMVAELRTQHSGPKLDGDVMLAKMRGTIYCPECEVQLGGGSATGMANEPYTHPMGSALPKPCSLDRARFEKPHVYVKRLAPAPYRKPIPA